MIEHQHVMVWPETRALVRLLKARLSVVGELVPVTMAGLLHVAMERLRADIDQGQGPVILGDVKRIRIWQLKRARGELGSYWHRPDDAPGRVQTPTGGGAGMGAAAKRPRPAFGNPLSNTGSLSTKE